MLTVPVKDLSTESVQDNLIQNGDCTLRHFVAAKASAAGSAAAAAEHPALADARVDLTAIAALAAL